MNTKVMLFLVFFLAITMEAQSQNTNIKLLGQYRGLGNITMYDISNNKLYLLSGNYLEIYDISDIDKIKKVGEYTYQTDHQSETTQIKVKDSYLYSNNGNKGLQIFDVSNPDSISLINKYIPSITQSAQGFTISDNFLFMKQIVGYGSSSIILADINNPLKITEKSTYRLPYYSENYSMAADNNMLYVLAQKYYETGNPPLPDLIAVDISDPQNPVELYRKQSHFKGLVLLNKYLLTTDSTYLLKIFDISDKHNPVSVKTISYNLTSIYFKNITFALDDKHLVVSQLSPTNTRKYWLYSYNSFPNIQMIDSMDLSSSYQGLKISNDKLFLNESKAIAIYDISNGEFNFEKKIENMEAFTAQKVIVDGNYAYLVSDKGFYIFDISDLKNLTLKSFIAYNNLHSLYKQGNYVYLGGSTDLQIVDVSNPSRPILKGLSNSPGISYDLFVEGDYAFAASLGWDYFTSDSSFSGFKIFNIKDKSNPLKITSVNTVEDAHAIYVDSGYVYVLTTKYYNAQESTNFRTFDISDIKHPTEKSTINFNSYSNKIVIQDTLAYIASDEGLKILDIKDKLHPRKYSEYSTNDACNDLSLENDTIGLAVDNSGFMLLDFKDKKTLGKMAEFNTNGRSEGIDIVGNKIFIADGSNGLNTFEFTQTSYNDGDKGGNGKNKSDYTPTKFTVLQNYPNPFNSGTVIEYYLPTDTKVDFVLYNSIGEKVRTLYTSQQDKGWHSLHFILRNLSSGVYFLFSKTTQGSVTKKIVYLK